MKVKELMDVLKGAGPEDEVLVVDTKNTHWGRTSFVPLEFAEVSSLTQRHVALWPRLKRGE